MVWHPVRSSLGIIFVDPDTYALRPNVSFDLPEGVSGSVPNPEDYDPDLPRHTIALVDASNETFGNHCWPCDDKRPHGSLSVETIRPADGIVRATFEAYVLNSCTGDATCALTGTVETTEAGVFYN